LCCRRIDENKTWLSLAVCFSMILDKLNCDIIIYNGILYELGFKSPKSKD
jgi:hypothetical protein